MTNEHACTSCGGLCPAGDELCPTCGLRKQVKALTDLLSEVRIIALDEKRNVFGRLAEIKRLVKK